MILLEDVISIEDLQSRWDCDRAYIETLIRNNRLSKWFVTGVRERPGGGGSFFVKPAQYTNGCVFDVKEVLAIESVHPELKVTQNQQEHTQAEDKNEDLEYISAEALRKEIQLLSPVRFIEFLRAYRKELPLLGISSGDRGYFYNTDPVNVVDLLGGIRIHRLDWMNFIKEIEKEEGGLPEKDNYCSAGDVKKDARIAELEKRLAELEASNTDLSTVTRTQAATAGKQEKNLRIGKTPFNLCSRLF